jgi:hypothetical protein
VGDGDPWHPGIGLTGRLLRRVILGCGPRYNPDDMYAGGLIGAYEALNAGITTIVDWCRNTLTSQHADAARVESDYFASDDRVLTSTRRKPSAATRHSPAVLAAVCRTTRHWSSAA